MQLPQIDPIAAAIARLAQRLTAVEVEEIAVQRVVGRVLAADLVADRPSPALDVSAMDGYALCLAATSNSTLPLQAIAAAGSPPLVLKPGQAIQIFTGAPIPSGADCVVRREDTTESLIAPPIRSQTLSPESPLPPSLPTSFPPSLTTPTVTLNLPLTSLHPGQNIRRQAENTSRGAVVLPAGSLIDTASIGAVASFAPAQLQVRKQVRVSVLNTGDELAEAGEPVEAWQIRDSNGPTLAAWLATLPWIEPLGRARVGDTLAAVRTALAEQLRHSDCVLLTGGVSMGDTDFVPEAIESLGGEIIFHRLPIRPGKPVLGAVMDGKLILGLPGNPVSVAVTSRVFGLPLLRKLAGCSAPATRPSVELSLSSRHDKPLDLTYFRLVNSDHSGQLQLTHSQGSGDLVSLSHSCGFVEIPPGQVGQGPFRLTLW